MKRILPVNIAVVLSLLFLSVSAQTTEDKKADSQKKVPAFETIKSLVGTWAGTETQGGHKTKETVKVSYEVTAAGSAVIETLYPGTRREMVSVYYLDGSDVKMTHYCTLGNQPHLNLSSTGKKGRQLNFTFIDATGMESPNEPHLGAFTLRAKDANHLQLEKVMWMEGGARKYVRNFNLVREK